MAVVTVERFVNSAIMVNRSFLFNRPDMIKANFIFFRKSMQFNIGFAILAFRYHGRMPMGKIKT